MSAGSAHPFEGIVRAHHDALLAFAVRLSRNPAEGRDLVQDTFERALRSFDRAPPTSNERAWLFAILNNMFVDRCRACRKAAQVELIDEVAAPVSERGEPSLSSTITRPRSFRRRSSSSTTIFAPST